MATLKAAYITLGRSTPKGMARPLPIICVLQPRMGAALGLRGSRDPDPDGAVLKMICSALDQRWGEFTKRRGGTVPTGVTDVGIFIPWASLPMSPMDASGQPLANYPQRSPHEQSLFEEALHGLHVLYASRLTTVWMLLPPPPPPSPPQSGGAALSVSGACGVYGEAWPRYLQLLATISKVSNHSDASAWPQLLELGLSTDGVERGRASQEKVTRAAPPEPLAFCNGHLHGCLQQEWEPLSRQYVDVLSSLLCGVEELDYRRCGWGDDEASRLAVVLPLCGRLKRLLLSQNQIGDIGVTNLASALSTCKLPYLELLALDNNVIGDAGAWALFRRMSPDEHTDASPLHSIRGLTLANNELSDASVMGLTGTLSALRACKRLDLEGNAATKATLSSVKKALKKAKRRVQKIA